MENKPTLTIKLKIFMRSVIFAACFMQAGYLIGEYLDYKYGPVPMVTPSELIALLNESNNRQDLDALGHEIMYRSE